MMKLFKKKKSDKNIANTISQQQQSRAFESPTFTKKPVPNNKTMNAATSITIPVANSVMDKSQTSRYSPPPIVMPKPRRMLTPTRAILGRFDHDKTQVEDEEPLKQNEKKASPHNHDLINQQEISPILLPTPHEVEPLMPQILTKPIVRNGMVNHQSSLLQPPQAAPVISPHSTVMSDDSSRVYESAVESLPESSVESDEITDLPDIPMLTKQQSRQSLTQQSQHQQDSGIASGILSEFSSSTMSPSHQQQRQSIVPAIGPSSTSSATVTPLFQRLQSVKQQTTDILSSPTTPASASSPVPALTVSDSTVTIKYQYQKQREEQELLLQLQKQVELMEQQRIKDRQEWARKEQEMIECHQQMIAMIETRDQSKNKEENANKAKEIFYQKQLKQQQLHQLQKQVLQHQQEQQHIMDMNDEADRAKRFNGQQQMVYDCDNGASLSDNEANDGEEERIALMKQQQRRIVNRSRSDEQLKFSNTRSSSRSSYYYNQVIADETTSRELSANYINNDGRRSDAGGRNDEGILMQQQQRKAPIMRRSSTASNKSSHRSEHQSPANSTIVSTPTASIRRKGPRPRARSIESARYYEEQMMNVAAANNHSRMVNREEMDDRTMHPLLPNQYRYPRRSRSVGRETRRPPSRALSAYNEYYNDIDGDLEDDEEGYIEPGMYDSGYYTHVDYMDHPPAHHKHHMMLRYNPQEISPHYGHPPRQLPPPQQQQYGQLYSPAIDYYQQQHYYQQQQQIRHTPRYNVGARLHHYNYN